MKKTNFDTDMLLWLILSYVSPYTWFKIFAAIMSIFAGIMSLIPDKKEPHE